jgi:hypothetical protein
VVSIVRNPHGEYAIREHFYESAIAAATPTNTVVRLCERGTDETLAFVVLDTRLTLDAAQNRPEVRQMIADTGHANYYLAVFGSV